MKNYGLKSMNLSKGMLFCFILIALCIWANIVLFLNIEFWNHTVFNSDVTWDSVVPYAFQLLEKNSCFCPQNAFFFR